MQRIVSRLHPDAASEGLSRFLLCDIAAPAVPPGGDWKVAASPMRCLARAIEGNPGCIAVRFRDESARQRRALIELCALLKRNAGTCGIPLLAVLPAKHRLLMSRLKKAGVDYLRIAADLESDSAALPAALRDFSQADLIEARLAEICPNLNYRKIDERRDLAVCGAYRNRLVLGGQRLHGQCETPGFLKCPYFIRNGATS